MTNMTFKVPRLLMREESFLIDEFAITIKAKYFIPLIIVGDLFFGITGTSTGVAHFAHLGGALFGFIMAYYWKKNSFDSHRWN